MKKIDIKDMKKTHYSIPNWKIKFLFELGKKYKVPFHNPPFDDSNEEGYYDIDKFRKTDKWAEFIKEIVSLGVHYEYSFMKGKGEKIFMPVQIWDKR